MWHGSMAACKAAALLAVIDTVCVLRHNPSPSGTARHAALLPPARSYPPEPTWLPARREHVMRSLTCVVLLFTVPYVVAVSPAQQPSTLSQPAIPGVADRQARNRCNLFRPGSRASIWPLLATPTNRGESRPVSVLNLLRVDAVRALYIPIPYSALACL